MQETHRPLGGFLVYAHILRSFAKRTRNASGQVLHIHAPPLPHLHILLTTASIKVIPMVLPLSYVKPGEQAHIVWIASELHTRLQLTWAGFFPGETLFCVQNPSCGGMGAYRIQDSVIAIRQERANEIFVEVSA